MSLALSLFSVGRGPAHFVFDTIDFFLLALFISGAAFFFSLTPDIAFADGTIRISYNRIDLRRIVGDFFIGGGTFKSVVGFSWPGAILFHHTFSLMNTCV